MTTPCLGVSFSFPLSRLYLCNVSPPGVLSLALSPHCTSVSLSGGLPLPPLPSIHVFVSLTGGLSLSLSPPLNLYVSIWGSLSLTLSPTKPVCPYLGVSLSRSLPPTKPLCLYLGGSPSPSSSLPSLLYISLALYLGVSVEHLVLQDHLPADLGAVVDNGVEGGPRAELPLPVGDGGEGCNDQEGPADAQAEHLVQEGDGLDGLPQAHLVGQDAVLPVGIRTR